MHLAEVYAASRTRMIDAAPGLTPEQVATVVPASPLWTVGDVYRHLSGLTVDVLGGNSSTGGTDDWTAAQVTARTHHSIAQVCAEWAGTAQAFDAAIAAAGFGKARAVLDLWTHEQDVRGTLGSHGDRADAALPTLVASLCALYRDGWSAKPELPTIAVVIDGAGHSFGGGDPVVTLRTTAYEFVRIALSRRSREQLLAADWAGGDPEPVFGVLCRFALPTCNIAD